MGKDIRIEYLPLSKLQRWPRNPKNHDLETLDKSYDRFGYVMPLLIDEKSGKLVAGHGRLEKLQARKDAGADAPERIRVKGSEWLVPVIRGVAFKSVQEAEAYLLADNALTIAGGWDDPELAAMLKGLAEQDGGLDGVGWSEDDVDALWREHGPKTEPPEDPGPQIDKAEELQAKWKVKRGDLWEIGRHRLMCGDSTSEEDVGRLMGGEKAVLFATDPPYGVAYDSSVLHSNKTEFAPIAQDELQDAALQGFLEGCFGSWAKAALQENAAWYLWHAMLSQGFFAAAAAAAAAVILHRQIIWAKPQMIFGRGDYHWKHELCFYGWQKGNRPPFYGERNQTTIWSVEYGEGRNNRDHPTQKPVELFAIPMRNHTKEGEVCAEPFTGSGSQFVAGEQLKRRVYGMEIEPKYCAVTIQRLADMGLKPKLSKG